MVQLAKFQCWRLRDSNVASGWSWSNDLEVMLENLQHLTWFLRSPFQALFAMGILLKLSSILRINVPYLSNSSYTSSSTSSLFEWADRFSLGNKFLPLEYLIALFSFSVRVSTGSQQGCWQEQSAVWLAVWKCVMLCIGRWDHPKAKLSSFSKELRQLLTAMFAC